MNSNKVIFAISTHSAREDGDFMDGAMNMCIQKFQPTPPARTETKKDSIGEMIARISTHSAREDGDFPNCFIILLAVDFNPLRPRGRRQQYYTIT